LDGSANLPTSTISTNALAAPEMPYAGECKSSSAYDGGVPGSTGCDKGTKRLSKLVNANDNNAYEMALAA